MQKAKELNHEEIGLSLLSNLTTVIQHPGPMVGPMNAIPPQAKLLFEVLHQLGSFIVHRLGLAVVEYGGVVLVPLKSNTAWDWCECSAALAQ
jgi:hypothetical protein